MKAARKGPRKGCNADQCVCGWVTRWFIIDLCLRSLLVIPPAHPSGSSNSWSPNHLMTLNPPLVCLCVWLDPRLCLLLPWCASSCMYDNHNHKQFSCARVIHWSCMQTLYFWVLWPIKSEDTFISQTQLIFNYTSKTALAFVFPITKREERAALAQRRRFGRCNANPVTPAIGFVQIVCSVFPSFFRCLFLLLYLLYLFKVPGGVCIAAGQTHSIQALTQDWTQRGYCGAVCRCDSLE